MARDIVTCDQCGKRLQVSRRYPIGPLAEIMGETLNSACLAIGVSGTTMQDARCHGITRRNADSLATRAGHHPYSVWPEMADHDIEDHSVPCANERCEETFIPSRKGHRFCSTRCQRNTSHREWQRRKYNEDPEFRARRLERVAAEYREVADYKRKYRRRYYTENDEQRRRYQRYHSDPEFRERVIATNREWREKQRAERESA